MKLYSTALSRQRGFVVLRNVWLFIVMDVMEILKNLYYVELFLYFFF